MLNLFPVLVTVLDFAFICCCMFVAQAANSAIPNQMVTFDPSRVEERLKEPSIPRNIKQDHFDKKPFEKDHLEEKFLLKKVDIQGLKSIKRQDIEAIIAHYVGKQIGFRSIQQLAEEIKQFYLTKGFFLVKTVVPIQKVTNGEIKIIVIEGFLAHVKINAVKAKKALQGDHLGIITAMTNKIKQMKAIDGNELEKSLLLLNDINAIESSTTIKSHNQTDKKDGAISLELEIKDTKAAKFNNFLSIDNFGSKYNGPAEMSIGSDIRGVLLSYDELSLRGLNTLQIKEASFLSANYKTPINAYGTIFSLGSNYIKTQPGANLKANNIIGNMHSISSSFSHPLIRKKTINLQSKVKFEAKNINTDILGIKLYQDKIRALRLSLQYDNIDSYHGANVLTITYSHGLNVLGARRSGSAFLSRTDGRSDFKKVEVHIARLQQISTGLNLLANFKGQLAFTPLLSSEEFGYGGQEFGRAYDPSELLGDHGIAGGVELRYLKLAKFYALSTQPFVFYDCGKVINKHSMNKKSATASSIGLGVKLWYNHNINGSLYYAIPLKKKLNTNGIKNKKSNRVLFNLAYSF